MGHEPPDASTLLPPRVEHASRVATASLATANVLADVAKARHLLHVGDCDDGTGQWDDTALAETATLMCAGAFAEGQGTWRHRVDAALTRAYTETDPAFLRPALDRVCAELVAWREHLNRRPT